MGDRQPFDPDHLRATGDDRLIFVPPGHNASFAHRIVTLKDTADGMVIMTKGDANPAPDPWHAVIKAKRIQEVIWAVPQFGQVMVWAQGPAVTVILVVVAGLFIAMAGVRSILHPGSPRKGHGARLLTNHASLSS